jgi:hypothetical protein
MGELELDIEELVNRDLSQLAMYAGLKNPRFGSTNLVRAGILPGEPEQQAHLYHDFILSNIERVEPSEVREALCVKLNLSDDYPDSGSQERLSVLATRLDRKIEHSRNGKRRNKRTEDQAREGQRYLAAIIRQQIDLHKERGDWPDLLSEKVSSAPARASVLNVAGRYSISESANPLDGNVQGDGFIQSQVPRWNRVDVEWTIDHLSFQEDWELTDDAYQACLAVARSWVAPNTLNRATRLKALQKPLLGLVRARIERASHEKEARRRALRRATDLIQSQATQPMDAEEKLQCYITLDTFSTDELGNIAARPTRLRELRAQALALVDERARERYEGTVYYIGAYVTQHYIEHGLGRSLGRGESQVAETILEKATEERMPYDDLLERMGRALGLDEVQLAVARSFEAAGEANHMAREIEAALWESYKGRLPPGVKIRFAIGPVEDSPYSKTAARPSNRFD